MYAPGVYLPKPVTSTTIQKKREQSPKRGREWRVLRLLRFVVPPTLRAVMLLCLVPCNSVLLSLIGTATTFMSAFELKAP